MIANWIGFYARSNLELAARAEAIFEVRVAEGRREKAEGAQEGWGVQAAFSDPDSQTNNGKRS